MFNFGIQDADFVIGERSVYWRVTLHSGQVRLSPICTMGDAYRTARRQNEVA